MKKTATTKKENLGSRTVKAKKPFVGTLNSTISRSSAERSALVSVLTKLSHDLKASREKNHELRSELTKSDGMLPQIKKIFVQPAYCGRALAIDHEVYWPRNGPFYRQVMHPLHML